MSLKKKKFLDGLFKTITFILAFSVVLPLFFILFYIVKKGISVINFDFIFSLSGGPGEMGGILNSIVGTLILVGIGVLIAFPLGVLVGIFLWEYKRFKFVRTVSLFVELLQGIPSIVLGLIGYFWFVKPFGTFSALAGGITLSFMMLPIIIKSTEETLLLIPDSLKEASLALGVPYYRTIIKVIIPSSLSGIFSGLLIGIGRIAGETAPLIFTAFGNPYLSTKLLEPIDSLPLLIYNYATSPYPQWHKVAWGASFVLILFILISNLSLRFVIRKRKVEF